MLLPPLISSEKSLSTSKRKNCCFLSTQTSDTKCMDFFFLYHLFSDTNFLELQQTPEVTGSVPQTATTLEASQKPQVVTYTSN